MATGTTEYSLKKEQKMLLSSYTMHERSIKETEERMRLAINEETGDRKFSEEDIKEQIKLLRSAQDDIVTKYVQNGGTEDEIRNQEKKNSLHGTIKPKRKSVSIKLQDEIIKNEKIEVKPVKKQSVTESIKALSSKKEDVKEAVMNISETFIPNTYDSQAAYDIIPLPSRGECYKSKISKIPVAYLTAYDENMIVSPNLYRDNLVMDYILENKIMNDEIDPSQLLDGDREAILLYLRAAGYGNEYPIMATDDKTGKEFEAIVDLSEIKFKDFNLVGDENGLFDYKLPVTGKNIKFKFLNHAEIAALDKLNEAEEKERIKEKVMYYRQDLEDYLELLNDETSVNDKIKVREALNSLEKWADSMKESDKDSFSHYLTNKMELSIISIDGNTDREYISDFVNNMPVRDSSSFRKYMLKNEPGLDYKFKVEKPASLGGGSMDVFLQFDQFIFLNIPE